jgi:hypothetical protein
MAVGAADMVVSDMAAADMGGSLRHPGTPGSRREIALHPDVVFCRLAALPRLFRDGL